MSMGGHQSPKMEKDEWLTPPEILEEIGPFDLDPCSPYKRPWDTARKHYSVYEDGLERPWEGRVWLNPPYGRETVQWMRKIVKHNNGTALIFARTETSMFWETVWEAATGILFLKGRIYFHHASGEKARANAGAPSVLIAYGEKDANILLESGLSGRFLWNGESP